MQVDLREKIRNEKLDIKLTSDHKENFENRLMKELHQNPKRNYWFFKVAAAVLLLFGMGYFTSLWNRTTTEDISTEPISLSDVSPEFKKIENYYLTAINYELTDLEVNEENKQIIENYFDKLNILTNEYKLLNNDFTTDKIDEEFINNLIDNLQLRLQLLVELKNELNKIKKQNEKQDVI